VAVAGVIGSPISGLLMEGLSGALGLAGWQWLFLAEGLPSIFVGIWVWFYLNSDITQAKWLGAEEKALLVRNLDAEDRHKHQFRVLDAFRSGRVYALCFIYFTLMIGLYGISFWLPSIVEAMGVKGYLNVGLVTAIPYAVAVVGMVLLSRSSDRTGERRLHYVFNVTVGSLGLALSAAFGSHPVLAFVFLAIGTLGVIGSMPIFWPVPSTFLAGAAAAAGIGLVNSVGNLGGYVGPNIPVWIKGYSKDPSVSLYVIAGALLSGALVALIAIPDNTPSTTR
jgi:MFS family permease